MHASIALYVMFFGGIMVPESEISTVPLRDDLTKITAIQDLEWKVWVKTHHLPPVPTLDTRPQSSDDRTGRYYPPTNPGGTQSNPPVMPVAPTDPSAGGGQAGGYTPQGRYGQQGGAGQGNTPRLDPYGNVTAGRNPVSGYGSGTGYTSPVASNANNYIANTHNSVNGYLNQYAPSIPTQNSSAGAGTGKAFEDYQRPNGYTPWQLLNQPTQNGTLNPYTSYVQPVMNQQNINQRLSERINGVNTSGGYGDTGTPGGDSMPVGAGMVNPGIMIDYTIH